MTSPSPEFKPVLPDSDHPTPKKSQSPTKKKPPSSPSAKTSLVGSKDEAREMKRIALETLLEFGVKGEGMNVIAAKSGLSPRQVGDLFRPNRQNMRSKALQVFDSGGL